MTSLRVGILSTATINDDVLSAMAAADGVEAVAVASRDPVRAEAYARERGIEQAYGSYAGLLEADDIDAVYIPLPNALHREWASAALAAGKHVLCEKPLTIHAAEAAELFAQADAAGLVLMEAFMYRHHPTVVHIREAVENGEIGEVQTIRSEFSFTVADPDTDIRLSAELGGGALRDVGCYCISFGRLVTGEDPVIILAAQTMTPSGVDERTTALLGYPSGATATFDVSIRSPLRSGAAIVGSAGAITVPTPWYAHHPPHEITVERTNGQSRTIDCSDRNSYQLELENFSRAVRGEEPPRIAAEETIGVLTTLEQIEAAAHRRTPTSASHGGST